MVFKAVAKVAWSIGELEKALVACDSYTGVGFNVHRIENQEPNCPVQSALAC